MPVRRLLIAIAITVQLVFAASAHAYVYWGDPHAGTIGRANNDGSDATDSFINAGGEPFAVAVNAAHIYWASKTGTIGRANIDGTGVDPNFIGGLGQPSGVAVTPSYIFWSDLKMAKIGRANLDGTGQSPNFISTEPSPCGVAVDSGNVYWTNNVGFEVWAGRAPFSGTLAEKTWFKIENNIICGVAVNSANLFWAGTGFAHGKTIGRASIIDGSGLSHGLIGEADGPCGLAVFGLQMYWANGGDGTIGRANTDGTDSDPELVHTGGGEICGVAVDSLASPLEPPVEPSPPAPPAGPPSAAPVVPPPSVRVVGDKLDKKNGTARVMVAVSGAGLVSLQGKGIVAAVKKARGAETVSLSVRAAKSKKATLRRVGRLKAKLSISFAPSSGGGVPTAGTSLTLVEKKASPGK
jgi:hypothetical protein